MPRKSLNLRGSMPNQALFFNRLSERLAPRGAFFLGRPAAAVLLPPSARSAVRTISDQRPRCTRQISCAYCAMVRSDENGPMPATLRTALLTQADASVNSVSTRCWVAT